MVQKVQFWKEKGTNRQNLRLKYGEAKMFEFELKGLEINKIEKSRCGEAKMI